MIIREASHDIRPFGRQRQVTLDSSHISEAGGWLFAPVRPRAVGRRSLTAVAVAPERACACGGNRGSERQWAAAPLQCPHSAALAAPATATPAVPVDVYSVSE